MLDSRRARLARPLSRAVIAPIAALVTALLLAPAVARAQLRLATVDSTRALGLTQQGTREQSTLRALQQRRQALLDQLQAQLQAERREIDVNGSRWDAAARQRREQAYREGMERLQADFLRAQTELAQAESRSSQPMVARLRQAAESVRARDGYDAVIEQSAARPSQGAAIDATAAVAAEYDRMFPASGQGAPGVTAASVRRVRVALYDAHRALVGSRAGASAQADLRRLFDERQRELDQRQSALAAARRDLDAQRAQLDAAALQRREQDIGQEQTALAQAFTGYQQELARLERERTEPITTGLQRAVDQVRDRDHYDAVLDQSAVLAVAPSATDITALVVTEFDRQPASGAARASAPARPPSAASAPASRAGSRAAPRTDTLCRRRCVAGEQRDAHGCCVRAGAP